MTRDIENGLSWTRAPWGYYQIVQAMANGPLLVTELAYYDSILADLLKSDEHRFALVIGEHLLGVYDSHSEAYRAGLSARGNVPMFIRRIERHETVAVWAERIVGVIHERIC